MKYQVNQYPTITSFEAALNAKEKDGWEIHSWQECGVEENIFIIAIFRKPE